MKNTLDNKAKFFAQYWGVKTDNSGAYSHIDGMVLQAIQFGIGDCAIELRPLSSITDEEAIEVAKIFHRYSNSIEYNIDYKTNTFREKFAQLYWMEDNERRVVINFCYDGTFHAVQANNETFLKAFQYIQFKGFALPYHNLSVEQLIEYGWVKLTGQ